MATGATGGDVVFRVSRRVRDLSYFADNPHQRAGAGGPGGKSRRTGARGADLVIEVPDGTRVEDEEGLLADLVGEGAEAVVARGGRGGRGSASLVSRRNRVPTSAEAGDPGEERRLRSSSGSWRTSASSACRTPASPRCSLRSPPLVRRSPTTPSRRSRRTSAWRPRQRALRRGRHPRARRGRARGSWPRRPVPAPREPLPGAPVRRGPIAEDPASDLRTVREEVQAYDSALAARPLARRRDEGGPGDGPGRARPGRRRRLGRDGGGARGGCGSGWPSWCDLGDRCGGGAQPYVVLRPARPRFVVRPRESGSAWSAAASSAWCPRPTWTTPRSSRSCSGAS